MSRKHAIRLGIGDSPEPPRMNCKLPHPSCARGGSDSAMVAIASGVSCAILAILRASAPKYKVQRSRQLILMRTLRVAFLKAGGVVEHAQRLAPR